MEQWNTGILFQIVIKVIKEKHRGFFCHHMAQDDFNLEPKFPRISWISREEISAGPSGKRSTGCCRLAEEDIPSGA